MACDCSLTPRVRRPLSRVVETPDAGRYRARSGFADLPPHPVAFTPVRGVNPATLHAPAAAARRCRVREVRHPPLFNPAPRWLRTAPHAWACDGFRRHLRRFCLGVVVSRDVLGSRLLSFRHLRASAVAAGNDPGWRTSVAAEIGSCPAVSVSQSRRSPPVHRLRKGRSVISARRAIPCRARHRLGFCSDPARTAPEAPEDRQFVLLDRDVNLGHPGQQRASRIFREGV